MNNEINLFKQRPAITTIFQKKRNAIICCFTVIILQANPMSFCCQTSKSPLAFKILKYRLLQKFFVIPK